VHIGYEGIAYVLEKLTARPEGYRINFTFEKWEEKKNARLLHEDSLKPTAIQMNCCE